MSVKIDNMGATTFTSTMTGILRSNPDNTTFASSGSQVRNAVLNVISLAFNGAMLFTGTWSSVLTDLIKTQNTTITNIRGTVINIGSSETNVKVLSNTLNIDSTWPTILSGVSNMGRVQAGYVTLPIGSILLEPPNVISVGTASVHTTGTTSGITGYNGAGGSGFNLVTTVAQEVNWVYFI